MKKKILFFTLLVSFIICLFAISSNAEMTYPNGYPAEDNVTYVYDTDGVTKLDPDWYTGNYALAIQDKESTVVLFDGTNYKRYPAYYVVKPSKVTVTDNVATAVDLNNTSIDYTWLNTKLETTYAAGALYTIEIPNGVTYISRNLFGSENNSNTKEPNHVRVVMPDSITKIDSQSFRMMPSCKEIVLSKNLTDLPSWSFSGSTKLETVVIPEGSELLTMGNAFSGCSALSSINLGNASKLTTLNGTFNSCSLLGEITLSDTIQTIGDNTFYNCTNLYFTSDYLPKSLKTIGSNITSTRFESHFLSGCKSMNDVLIFPEGFSDLGASYSFQSIKTESGNPIKLVFLGKMTRINFSGNTLKEFGSITLYFAQNSASDLNGEIISSDLSAMTYDPTSYEDHTGDEYTLKLSYNEKDSINSTNGNINSGSAKLVFCGDGTKEPEYVYIVRFNHSTLGWNHFYSVTGEGDISYHLKDSGEDVDATCVTPAGVSYTCICCGRSAGLVQKEGAEPLGHDYTVSNGATITIAYANGYDKAGLKEAKCSRCTHIEESTVDAIFEALGYSIKNDGTGFTGDFKINRDALVAYNEYSTTALKYGILMSNGSLDNGITFDSKYTLTSDFGIQLGVNDPASQYSKLGYTISEFDITDKALTNLEIAIAIYVIDEQGVKFVQRETVSVGETSVTVEGQNSSSLKTISLAKIAESILPSVQANTQMSADIKERLLNAINQIITTSKTTV